jgi:hypothetical protein
MSESVRTSIVDKDWNNRLLSVVQSTVDPTKYGIVVCNPDGSKLGQWWWTGNVVGPATNTADYIPQWNWANSKTLKDWLAVPVWWLAWLTALGGKEDASNKATTFWTINDTLYPTVKAVNDAITSAVVGLLDYRGSFDASTNLFPATWGSGTLWAILKWDFWICSVAWTLWGTAVTPWDLIIALQDTPAQTAANWDLIEYDRWTSVYNPVLAAIFM